MLKLLQYISVGAVGLNLLISGVFVLSANGDEHALPEIQIDHGDMLLLSEAPPPPPPQEQEEEAVASFAGDTSDSLCFKLGPFHNDQHVEAVQRSLEELAINTMIFSHEEGEVLGYWVYLKPQRSTALARLKMEELKGKGITDLFLVKKDEPKLAISLGVFRNKLTAQKRQRHIRSLGYQPQLNLRYKVKPETWLLIEADEENAPSTDGWNLLLKNYKGVISEKSDC
jgi:hypothetical protein